MAQVNYKFIRNILLAFTISTVLILQASLHGRLNTKTNEYLESKNSSSDGDVEDYSPNSESSKGGGRIVRAILADGDEVTTTVSELPTSQSPPQDPKLLFSKIPPELILKNYYKGKFSMVNPSICSRKKNITLVILITTAVEHFELRNAVRSTWINFSLRMDIAYAFVIGDSLFSKYNSSVIERLRSEIALYDDFIVANFEDTYRNLALKTLHMLEWLTTFCTHAEYFLKTDDDVFVNAPRIIELISSVKEEDEKTPKIYGHVFGGHLPNRNIAHRHYVPYNVYPEEVRFPDFTSGPAYLMSTTITRPLLELALEFPFVPLEDVLVTGFVAASLNIPRVHMDEFINEMHTPIDLNKCDLIRMMGGMTNGSEFQMYTLWHRYLDGKSTCKAHDEPKNYFKELLANL